MRRILPFGLSFVLLLCACSRQGELQSDTLCCLVVEDGEGFRVEHPAATVRQGQDAAFTLTPEAGWRFAGADYPDYSLEPLGEREVLTLHNVRYSVAVTVTYAPDPRRVTYHGNGGFTEEGAAEAELPVISAHLRSNTSQGIDLFSRDGYTLYGWNTAPDGSGTAVGLGGRIDVPEEGLELYAVWQSWSAASDFETEPRGGGIAVTGYHGTDDVLCVPARIDGQPVTTIAPNAFTGLENRAVILPAGLETVETGAFRDARMAELWLFDDIETLDGGAFDGCDSLATLHINAATPPRYSGNYFDTFSDKFDRLLSLAGQQKLILFSGSSTRFGYDSAALDEAFPEYEVVNMGVFAYTNALPQLELILTCAGEGDILLHAPEFDAARHQFCTTTDLDIPFFCMMESNYDIISLLDLRQYTNVFPALSAFLDQRRAMPKRGYQVSPSGFDEDGNAITGSSYNEYGDYILYRPNAATEDPVYGAPVPYTAGAFPEDAFIRPLNAVYDRFQGKGVQVFFSYAPRNALALSKDSTPEARAALDTWFRQTLHAPVISPMEESLYSGVYLYGTDNHLSTEGVSIRTERIVRDLNAVLSKMAEGGSSNG